MSNKFRLFLDQMIDIDVAQSLRIDDFDVQCTVDVNMSRANDLEILRHCIVENRTLITLDEHFGDWTLIHLKKHPGVIRLKVNPTTTKNIKDLLLPFLQANKSKEFENRLVIVKSTGIRWVYTA